MQSKLLFAALTIPLLISCSASRHLSRTVDVTTPVFDSISPQWQTMAKVVALNAGLPPTQGNAVEIYTDGVRQFADYNADLQGARQFVDMEFFRFANDSIGHVVRDILTDKAGEGVPVRIIMETRANPHDPKFYGPLYTTENISVGVVQPGSDVFGSVRNVFLRDHRKITVVDGKVAYTGGMNIRDVYYDDWRDTRLRLTGPVVGDMETLFSENWERFLKDRDTVYAWTGEKTGSLIIQAASDGHHIKEQPVKEGFEQAIAAAEDYIYIQTPYFCPPKSTLDLLARAAERGVDVRLMLPKGQDVIFMLWTNHFFYKQLLRGGIRLYERDDPFMHSKTYVADDYLSGYGSANLDNRSYNLNDENMVYIFDRETALRGKEIFMEDLRHSREIHLEEVHWNPGETIMQWFCIGLGYKQW